LNATPIFSNIHFSVFVKHPAFKNTKTENNISETSLVLDLRKRGPLNSTTLTKMKPNGPKVVG
jgi:hypothetical protein